MHDADHAGLAHASVDRNAPLGELGGHHIGGAHFLKTQLGVGVDVPTDGRDGGGVGQDGFMEFHADSLAACKDDDQTPR